MKVAVRHHASLEAARESYFIEVDNLVGAVRGKYITSVPGQAETYTAKALDAQAFMADPSAPCPWIEAEAAATGMTKAEAAQTILAMHAEWTRVGSALERIRIGTKAEIRTAADQRGMYQAVERAKAALSTF